MHLHHKNPAVLSTAALSVVLTVLAAWEVQTRQAPPAPAAHSVGAVVSAHSPVPKRITLGRPVFDAPPSGKGARSPAAAFRGLIGQAALLPLDAPASERARLAAAMAALGAGAVEELGAALQAAPTVSAKSTIAQALARIGSSEAIDHLIPNLASIHDPAERAAVAQSLGALSNPVGLETLTSALAVTDDPVLRQSINAAISQQATGDTVQFLTELYREQPSIPSQPDDVAAALSGIASPAAASQLRQIVNDAPELVLQAAAANSLALIGTPDALEGIVDGVFRVGDTNPPFRQALLSMLETVSNPQAAPWLAQMSTSLNLPPDMISSLQQALANLRQKGGAL